jgi:hypothetical protein
MRDAYGVVAKSLRVQKPTGVFVNKLEDPESTTSKANTSKAKKKWILCRRRLTGAMLLPFVNDFALFANSLDAAMELKEVTFTLLDDLGLHSAHSPEERVPFGDTGGEPPRDDTRPAEKRGPRPRSKSRQHFSVGKVIVGHGGEYMRWYPRSPSQEKYSFYT